MTRTWLLGVVGIVVGVVLASVASVGMGSILIGGQPNPAWETNSMLLWLRADAGAFQDTAGTNPAVNSASVALWLDQSTYGRKAQQATSTYQPTFSTTGLNGRLFRF